ncbi:MAG: sigma 54-interacting transcriptional regulator [Myxococcales bacterium]|nr:sigma 54-interacting transcriptional regulator [Myxococcales bacterium]
MSEASTRTILRPRGRPAGVRVTVVAGPSAGASAAGRKITVGRSRVADVSIADLTVSEFHLELSGHEGGIEVRDLDSYNGTFFESARVLRAVVPRGATLSIGESLVTVDTTEEPEPQHPARESFHALFGKSEVMRELFGLLERLAPTELATFIEGPTGSGKELVARALHEHSPRAAGPLVVLDCAALPLALAESILFGHAAGAFTGAVEHRAGVFEAADGGTIFLDEVGELPLDLQPKLLRVLEQRQVTRLGESRPRPVSVRVVSATLRDLRRMVNQGQFRDDLYYRIAQTRLVIPSLAERREDIEGLVTEFLRRLPRSAPAARSISREALGELAQRDFPGNVRELKNTVERAAYMCDGPVIRPQDLAFERMLGRGRESEENTTVPDRPSTIPSVLPPAPAGEVPEFKGAKRTAVDDFERGYLQRLMAKTQGNIAVASGLAGIERHYLRSLLKKHGLHSSS